MIRAIANSLLRALLFASCLVPMPACGPDPDSASRAAHRQREALRDSDSPVTQAQSESGNRTQPVDTLLAPLPMDLDPTSAYRTLRAIGGFRIVHDDAQTSLWLGEDSIAITRMVGCAVLSESGAVIACLNDRDFPSGIVLLGAGGRQAARRGGEPKHFAAYALGVHTLISFSSDAGGTGRTRQICDLWTYDPRTNALRDSLSLLEVYDDFAPDSARRRQALRGTVDVFRRNRHVFVVYQELRPSGSATRRSEYLLSNGRFIIGETSP
jgi:hypothetical protein